MSDNDKMIRLGDAINQFIKDTLPAGAEVHVVGPDQDTMMPAADAEALLHSAAIFGIKKSAIEEVAIGDEEKQMIDAAIELVHVQVCATCAELFKVVFEEVARSYDEHMLNTTSATERVERSRKIIGLNI